MSASVCPTCNALLTTKERENTHCPKCSAILPEAPEVKTLSDRKVVSRFDRFNDASFCNRMSLACLALAIGGLLLGCVSFQWEPVEGKMNSLSVLFSSIAFIVLIGSAISGYFGLSGGIRNAFVSAIVLSAFGLILAGVQLAFWFVSISGILSNG